MQQHEFAAGGHRLSASSWGDVDGSRPVVVMLHGGLDCTSTWRDLPQAVAETTRLPVLSYDRWGYGGSDALTGGRDRSYRFEESGPVFGEVLRHFGITSAILFGHSDGGAMSLLAAAAHPKAVRAICACSPTISLDLHMVRGMEAARQAFEHGGLRERLMRHHGDKTDAMFWGWHAAWSTEDAILWSMAEQLAAVRCPVAALFGQADDYGWRPSATALVTHGACLWKSRPCPASGMTRSTRRGVWCCPHCVACCALRIPLIAGTHSTRWRAAFHRDRGAVPQ